MLLSALRCLLIELAGGLYTIPLPQSPELDELAGTANDIQFVVRHYEVPADLKADLLLLWEIRNEIIHPAHGPGRDGRMTPEYLLALRDRDLLQSTRTDTDYIWIEQLKSHNLFKWSFSIIRETVGVLMQRATVATMKEGILATYGEFARIDLAVRQEMEQGSASS